MNLHSSVMQNGPSSAAPVLVQLSKLSRQDVRWLWPGRIPLGKLTLLAGDPGLGKSFLTLDIAARVTRGVAWPDDAQARAPQGSVVLLNAEDGLEDTVCPRLERAGAKLDHVMALAGAQSAAGGPLRGLSLHRDLELLRGVLKVMPDCRLVVIDPISAYLGHIDGNSNTQVRSLLLPLSQLAAERNVAVVAVTHLNKKSVGRALYRAMGSLAFVAAARAAWGVVRDPSDDKRRLLLPVKNNLSPQMKGLAFRLAAAKPGEVPTVKWDKVAIDQSLDQLLGPSLVPEQLEHQEKTDYADDWLCEQLSHGPISHQDLLIHRLVAGVSESQMYRAARRLGVIKIKEGYTPQSWKWKLPEE